MENKDEFIAFGVIRQRPLRDLEKFAISTNEKIDSVELKKKSGHGEF